MYKIKLSFINIILMQRKQVIKNFNFDNHEVENFLQDFRQKPSMEKSIDRIGEELFIKVKFQEEFVEEESKSSCFTPKKLKKLKMPEKDKAEKMVKCNYDANYLTDFAKALKSKYFDTIDSPNSENDQKFFTEKISQSEISNRGYLSKLIEQSIDESIRRNEYLLYLSCQITPDLNGNILSKSSLKEKEKAEKKINSGEKITHHKPNRNPGSSEVYCSDSSDNRYYSEFEKKSALLTQSGADLDFTKSEENQNLKIIKIFDANNPSINLNEETGEDFIDFTQQKKASFLRSWIHSPDLSKHFADISELMKRFNLNKEFLLNYLDANKSCDIEGRDSHLNYFKISNNDFANQVHKIDFDIDNSYYKLAQLSSSEITHFFILSNVLIFSKVQNHEENPQSLKKVEANWRFSVLKKEDELYCNTLSLDQIQIYF